MNTGRRRMSAYLLRAQDYADHYQAKCTRGQAIGVVKKARKSLELSLSDIGVLDALFADSWEQDWLQGHRPLVWPSNDELCERTGLSLAAVKRHLRSLIYAGLIYPRDSPTGQRSGRRDHQGKIIKAYGFDLSPIGTRYEELQDMAAQELAKKKERRLQEREFTVLRKSITMILESGYEYGLVGPWDALRERLDTVIEERGARIPLSLLVEKLRELKAEFEEIYAQSLDLCRVNMNPAGFTDEPPILTTNLTDNRNCNQNQSDAYASQNHSSFAYGEILGSPMKPEADLTEEQDKKTHQLIKNVTPSFVIFACPSVEEYGLSDKNWKGLEQIASHLRSSLGISEHAWKEATEILGYEHSSVAFAIILEKYSSGAIGSPGGYLRGMTEKARAGELNLIRSLHGLAQNRTLQ